MVKKLKIALIGCGYWGTNWARNLATHAECEFVGFCDENAKRLAKTQAAYPAISAFTDYSSMLKEAQPEAVVIATPPPSHAGLAVQALESGCHVLIEKPMASSSAECERILQAAEKNGKRVMIDNTLLFYPPVQKLIRTIQQGELGRLLYYDSIRANLGGFQPQANVLWDLAPHEFSILDLLTNHESPEEIVAVGNKHFGSQTESICYLNLKYAGNFNAHLHLNWAAPVKTRRLIVAGDRKMAELDDGVLTEKLRIYDKSVKIKDSSVASFEIEYHSGAIVVPEIPAGEALAAVLGEFVAAIRENRDPSSDGQAGARVVRMLEAAGQSLTHNGRPEKLKSPSRKLKAA